MWYLRLFLKGQSNEIFTSGFFNKRLILVLRDVPQGDFEFCRTFVELFLFKIPRNRLPAITDSGVSKIEPQATRILKLVSSAIHAY
jgi:hypothetical protein